jgi:hypothetical protein
MVSVRATFKEDAWHLLLLILTAVELAMVTWAWSLIRSLRRERTQARWLKARFATELLRGLRASQPMIDPLHPQVVRHDPAWHRFALVAGLLARAEGNPREDLDSIKQRYLSDRLEAQRRHFLDRAVPAARLYRSSHFVAEWASWLAPPFVLIATLVKASNQQWIKQNWVEFQSLFSFADHSWWGAVFVYLLPVALPLAAGTATALRTALDSPRRAHRYPEVAARLGAIADRFADLRTFTSTARAIARTEEMLLDELIEWRLVAENTGAH